ncbi:uncharacterized protein TRAVEDRAFT_23620 [Trametes versicolor FP-101664 SS1]|uniref:uncharacterized protein n=1 Tax=Trametes versicolor (strain FP-101664) TaxID=717944 RepID=UPI00046221EE|nr:uncharacterized protein TRAVEDRAFT_23620 [Trametes versicolor FP-101664 SS1]EIW53185.1 hypothetical protein TRAVEDRAFT_23620 [Trametes versicolor FP-101664 SS1]
MLVRVIPPYGQADIMFNCTMSDPMHDDDKPCPGSWRVQLDTLEALQEEGLALEYPRDIHALDKAAWQSALMTEIIFDVRQQVLACIFFDGYTVSWPLQSTANVSRCMASLELVMSTARGINPGPESGRRSWGHDLPSAPVSEAAPALQSETSSISTSSHRSKHKRQRSLLGSIVSAFKGILPDNMGRNSGPILPSSLPPLKIPSGHARSASTFSRTQISPPGSPTVCEPPPPPPSGFRLVVRPREPIPPPPACKPLEPDQILRRYARSVLLDTVREHVYPMFSTTGPPSFEDNSRPMEWAAQVAGYPPGLYPAWAARSMLRQTEDRLREMIMDANARGVGDAMACGAVGSAPMTSQSSRDSDDSDDTISASTSASATSLTTETDGSSVHTPLDSPTCSPFVPSTPSFAKLPLVEPKMLPQVPRSPSPPPYDFDMSAYHALTNLRARLFSILSRLGSTPRQIHNLQLGIRNGSDLTVLEIKSRRRAWSCRDFVGGARLSLVGLSTPARSSPLARCEPVTAEMVAQLQAQAAQETGRTRLACLADEGAEFGIPGACAGVKVMTKELDSRLFSLEEEDEEDEEEPHAGYQSGYGFQEYVEDEEWRSGPEYDLESGLLAFPRPEAVAPSGPSSYALPPSHSHPMVRTRTRSMRVERPSVPSAESEPHSLSSAGGGLSPNSLLCQPLNVKVPVPVILDNGSELAGGLRHGSEFTLSMDLPSPFSPAPRGWVGDNVAGAPWR